MQLCCLLYRDPEQSTSTAEMSLVHHFKLYRVKEGKKIEEYFFFGEFSFHNNMSYWMYAFLNALLNSTDKLYIEFFREDVGGNFYFKYEPDMCADYELRPNIMFDVPLGRQSITAQTFFGIRRMRLLLFECLISAKWLSMGHNFYYSSPKKCIRRNAYTICTINVEAKRITYLTSQGIIYFGTHSTVESEEYINAILSMMEGAYINTPASLSAYCFRSIWKNKIQPPKLPMFKQYEDIRKMLLSFRSRYDYF